MPSRGGRGLLSFRLALRLWERQASFHVTASPRLQIQIQAGSCFSVTSGFFFSPFPVFARQAFNRTLFFPSVQPTFPSLLIDLLHSQLLLFHRKAVSRRRGQAAYPGCCGCSVINQGVPWTFQAKVCSFHFGELDDDNICT